jgi:hypothetical protein
MTERTGIRWIRKAKSDVELPIGVAASTATVLDTALSVESKHLVELGSEASGGEEQLRYVRVIPLILPRAMTSPLRWVMGCAPPMAL